MSNVTVSAAAVDAQYMHNMRAHVGQDAHDVYSQTAATTATAAPVVGPVFASQTFTLPTHPAQVQNDSRVFSITQPLTIRGNQVFVSPEPRATLFSHTQDSTGSGSQPAQINAAVPTQGRGFNPNVAYNPTVAPPPGFNFPAYSDGTDIISTKRVKDHQNVGPASEQSSMLSSSPSDIWTAHCETVRVASRETRNLMSYETVQTLPIPEFTPRIARELDLAESMWRDVYCKNGKEPYADDTDIGMVAEYSDDIHHYQRLLEVSCVCICVCVVVDVVVYL